ncbi:folylpolyglutamate synthase, putative [Perkinsus marinus ATCC 50983]|uniref:Folylpolyglutamate synthase, putative n=1 Tax=Perkinsus marinus (strain ATCC 50983 / TXsc) TaxID=423536 RepID=C5L4J8_PERM5|nr:folylpolyglutamate synthase, putative [Perkinsus marinus ATCC 50983]EER08329.1 folylpolyglutamate synthase, putative [Perkinsus marinus ATCC 50983]|eukprot:XP_002776513.1 folylpolyglutamate synthase, putative [Perkinsus marinus ATCC 50983]
MPPLTEALAASNFCKGAIDQSTESLQRMRRVMEAVGNPLETLAASGSRFVHVTGTNGKGTVCSGLAARLQSYRVGVFTSPCQRWPNDQISISGDIMPALEYEQQLKFIMREAHQKGEVGLTNFEATTIAAFSWFARMRPLDFVIIEVGVGGRDDATNVLPKTDVAVLTGVALDHVKFLGPTLEDICSAKCGIITPHTTTAVASGAYLNASCLNIVKERCASTGTALRVVTGRGDSDDYKAHYAALEDEVLSALGVSHQQNHPSDTGTYLHTLRGRQELTHHPLNPTIPIILDGAHNEEGLRSLTHFIQRMLDQQRDITEVAAHPTIQSPHELFPLFLKPFSVPIATVYPTTFRDVPEMPWVEAVDPEEAVTAARQ